LRAGKIGCGIAWGWPTSGRTPGRAGRIGRGISPGFALS